jgi:hypothetical protein
MNEPHFSWDDNKAKDNAKKHGVSFEEATTAFRDDEGLRMYDPDHSDDEDRFVLLGLSNKGRLLVVSHCYRKHDDEIRLISARKATKPESQQYQRRQS